jgi:hypothetical protein
VQVNFGDIPIFLARNNSNTRSSQKKDEKSKQKRENKNYLFKVESSDRQKLIKTNDIKILKYF